jgi:hypothetical protein
MRVLGLEGRVKTRSFCSSYATLQNVMDFTQDYNP